MAFVYEEKRFKEEEARSPGPGVYEVGRSDVGRVGIGKSYANVPFGSKDVREVCEPLPSPKLSPEQKEMLKREKELLGKVEELRNLRLKKRGNGIFDSQSERFKNMANGLPGPGEYEVPCFSDLIKSKSTAIVPQFLHSRSTSVPNSRLFQGSSVPETSEYGQDFFNKDSVERLEIPKEKLVFAEEGSDKALFRSKTHRHHASSGVDSITLPRLPADLSQLTTGKGCLDWSRSKPITDRSESILHPWTGNPQQYNPRYYIPVYKQNHKGPPFLSCSGGNRSQQLKKYQKMSVEDRAKCGPGPGEYERSGIYEEMKSRSKIHCEKTFDEVQEAKKVKIVRIIPGTGGGKETFIGHTTSNLAAPGAYDVSQTFEKKTFHNQLEGQGFNVGSNRFEGFQSLYEKCKELPKRTKSLGKVSSIDTVTSKINTSQGNTTNTLPQQQPPLFKSPFLSTSPRLHPSAFTLFTNNNPGPGTYNICHEDKSHRRSLVDIEHSVRPGLHPHPPPDYLHSIVQSYIKDKIDKGRVEKEESTRLRIEGVIKGRKKVKGEKSVSRENSKVRDLFGGIGGIYCKKIDVKDGEVAKVTTSVVSEPKDQEKAKSIPNKIAFQSNTQRFKRIVKDSEGSKIYYCPPYWVKPTHNLKYSEKTDMFSNQAEPI